MRIELPTKMVETRQRKRVSNYCDENAAKCREMIGMALTRPAHLLRNQLQNDYHHQSTPTHPEELIFAHSLLTHLDAVIILKGFVCSCFRCVDRSHSALS